ncbi:lysozyme inhibitor LprI family protein [Zavarzinia aquatilis]|uniref:Lysozyme inhibitor LprI N-terminal domain-containing protein n=1 Tax=Zavarzinia aquatilis TaxID=2211142 RepID=A0A317EHU0_9PROT|nr:lysozyme inhibitor LprI family protein [Zavarzinia aquatilis]PWR24785.1 hypothetical protein DKG74_08310 [Zavarzinia aquatilis]
MRRALLLGLALAGGFAPAALAFDCAKAKAPVELAICADPALKAADDRMSAAYATLRGASDEAQRTAWRGDQRDWIERRDGICAQYDQGQETSFDRACLKRMTEERTRELSATAETQGPGAPRFLPVLTRVDDAAAQISVSILRPRAVDDAFAPLNAALEQAADASEAEIGGGEGPYGRTVSYRILYASARFVSVFFDIYEYTGGAHGMSYGRAVNFLPAAGRALAFDDFIDEAGRKALIPLCRDSIAAEKRERGVPDELIAPSLTDEALGDGIDVLPAWSFDAKGARIRYDAYALGAYAEGSYDCAIGWTALKPLLKPGAPLPFD